MRKQFLLMTMTIATVLFVSGQSAIVNAEEKPATESAQVITEKTGEVQAVKEQPEESKAEKTKVKKETSKKGKNKDLQEIQEETKESASAEAKLAGNSIGTATPISLERTYNGSITSSDSKDFYKFTLSSSGRVGITAIAEMESIEYRIYDSYDFDNTLWYHFPWQDNATELCNTNDVLDLTKGTYYLVVSDDHYRGNYHFNLSFSSAGESFAETGYGSNNSLRDSDVIAPNKTYKGQIASNDVKDFYKFTLNSATKVTLSATATGIKGIEYCIYNSYGNKLWSDDVWWNDAYVSNISEVFNLTRGTYYFSASSSYYTGNYNFKLSTHSHSYKTSVSKATPSRHGKIVKRCSCGATSSTSTIYAPKKMYLSTSKYTYSGKVRKPSVKIKDSKGRTISSSNYKVTYSKGRKYVGRYTVKVTFRGNYSGTMYKKFDIVPKKTSVSKVSKGRKSFTVKWRRNRSQTSGYQVQYSTNSKFKKGNKTVTIKSNKSSSKKIKKLRARRKYYVRVRTYKNVKISGKTVRMYSGWSKAKAVRTR